MKKHSTMVPWVLAFAVLLVMFVMALSNSHPRRETVLPQRSTPLIVREYPPEFDIGREFVARYGYEINSTVEPVVVHYTNGIFKSDIEEVTPITLEPSSNFVKFATTPLLSTLPLLPLVDGSTIYW